MAKTAYQLDASGVVANLIVIDGDTDPADFGAVAGPEGTAIGWRLVAGEWITPEQEPTEPAPLSSLTARQLRLGLLKIGIKPADVAAAIAALSADQRDAAAIEWDYASEYRRDHPLIAQLGATFGLTSEQIDDAWREAMTL
jgi:hypothetical protein